jgi:hypothetical protein
VRTRTDELMLFAQRRDLHARIAAEIRNRFGDGRWSELTSLAYHYLKAEMYPEALQFYKKAGDVATYNWALHEAVSHYGEASAIADRLASSKRKSDKDVVDLIEHVSIKRKHAIALLNVGAFNRAGAELRDALQKCVCVRCVVFVCARVLCVLWVMVSSACCALMRELTLRSQSSRHRHTEREKSLVAPGIQEHQVQTRREDAPCCRC